MRCLLRKAPKLLETVIPTQGGFSSKVCEARTALPGTPSQALWGKETRNALKGGLELVSPEMFPFSLRSPLHGALQIQEETQSSG